MNESEEPASASPEVIRRPPRRPARGALWLLLIALLAAAAWYGYREWLRLGGEAARREQTVARLEREVAALQRAVADQRQAHTELAGTVARVGALIEGGRARVQLAAVEQLLLLANDRLLLARDVNGARRALQLADGRLAALEDPALLPVREALAAELAALDRVPQADVAGAALRLGQIMRDVPRFTPRARVPERFEAAPPADTAPPPGAGAPQRAWSAIKTALSAMFTLRRREGPPLRLLAPEEEELAARILQLKLEGARIALLSGDGAALNDLARGARDWLLTYYNDGDPAVRGARETLEQMAALTLDAPPPDIGRSLELLRARFAERP